jgi:cholesterol oxidase
MDTWDFIVIGSGYGGALAAVELRGAGARVLLLERGPRIEPQQFQQSWDPFYLKTLYDTAFSTSLTELYRASRCLGGGSVLNSMMHHRAPSEAFDGWPEGVDRAALDPHYSELEQILGVRQLPWDRVPQIGGHFARMFHEAGLSCDRGRMNIGPGCVRCGFCEAGCTFQGGKNTLMHLCTVPADDLRTGLTAVRVRALPGGGYGVECIPSWKELNSKTDTVEFKAPSVILAAGPIGTVPLLLRSRSGLRRLSGRLGERVSNNGDVNFVFETPDHFEDHAGERSTNNSGVITYAFWDQHRVTMHPGCAPVGVLAGIDARRPGHLPWGLEHKHLAHRMALKRLIPVNAMRIIEPTQKISLAADGSAKVHSMPHEQTRAHGELMFGLARSVADACGGKVWQTGIGDLPLDTGGNHILGGACMADDPSGGVCDPLGQVFGHRGLYVLDSSCVPGALGINPALTVGANALRIAEHILKDMGVHP